MHFCTFISPLAERMLGSRQEAWHWEDTRERVTCSGPGFAHVAPPAITSDSQLRPDLVMLRGQ